MKLKNISVLIIAVFFSLYYFPLEIKGATGLNSKLLMAVFGMWMMFIHWVKGKGMELHKQLFISSLFAFLFSLVCYYSVTSHNSPDYDYATYIISMWVWYAAAYLLCSLLSYTHGYISIKLIANYLIVICVTQCILALLIDFIPPFRAFVDYFSPDGNRFYKEVNRLYGIGAALDVAGIKFAVVLGLISVLLLEQYNLSKKKIQTWLYMGSFVIIAVVGNMISRTTTVGMALGVGYLIYGTRFWSGELKGRTMRIWKFFITILIIMFSIVAFLYVTNPAVSKLLRFGFEGFFSWIETGTWQTSSTDKLQTMWVFPTNEKTWLLGDGRFMDPIRPGIYYMETDAGYCRFIFYCGLIGLTIFSTYFIYLSFALRRKFPYAKDFFILLLVMVFINWMKVATDLFVVYAIFLAILSPYLSKKYKEKDLL